MKSRISVVHNDKHTRFRTRKAATNAARKCSRDHRGEWCDVVVNERRVAQCFKGKCKRG